MKKGNKLGRYVEVCVYFLLLTQHCIDKVFETRFSSYKQCIFLVCKVDNSKTKRGEIFDRFYTSF